MRSLHKGRYIAALAASPEDHQEARALRAHCFGAFEQDAFDEKCVHVLLRDAAMLGAPVVCCFRMLLLSGAQMPDSYAAQYYDLDALTHYDGRLVELGRFCVDPSVQDPDVVRVAWGAITRFVDENDVKMLFGCTSFAGTDAAPYLDAFAVFKTRHLAPARWAPAVKSPDVFRYCETLRRKPDLRKATACMPPLLRTYLLMGGWVSDHAVVDHKMGTLHVFTGVEIATIPPARKRVLRALVDEYQKNAPFG